MKCILLIFLLIFSLNSDELIFSSGENNVLHKISSEILQKAYSDIGIKTKFIYGNFEESLTLSNSGLIDGEIARLKKLNKKYTELLLVPVAINYMDAVAFSKDKTIHISKWEDLKAYNVGIVEGTKCIESGTSCMLTSSYEGFDELFKALNTNKVDIIITPKITGLYIISKKKYENIHLISKSLDHVKMYHFLHKKNKVLVPKITKSLQNMKDNGELASMRDLCLKNADDRCD